MDRNRSLKGPLILPKPLNLSSNRFMDLGSISSSSSSVNGRSKALKVHSLAEKRRRERINEHLSTLRCMLPDAKKMDKATLLLSVIDHVKELKRKATDISNKLSVPAEINEVNVESKEVNGFANSENYNSNFYIKASVCCDDHPDLFMNIMKAFHVLKLRAIRAEIASLGGRVKIVFILICEKDAVIDENFGIRLLVENVKDVLERIASIDVGLIDGSSSKRQRLLQSYYSSVSV